MDDNVVFRLTIAKKQPECVDYEWKVEQVYSPEKPESVEQLNVAVDILKKLLRQSEQATLHAYLETSRKIRKDLMKERLKSEKAAQEVPPDVVH